MINSRSMQYGLLCSTSSFILTKAWYNKLTNRGLCFSLFGGFMIGYVYGVLGGPIIPALYKRFYSSAL